MTREAACDDRDIRATVSLENVKQPSRFSEGSYRQLVGTMPGERDLGHGHDPRNTTQSRSTIPDLEEPYL